MEHICRTCLKNSEEGVSVLEDSQLSYKIEIIASIKISVDDNLPKNICAECVVNLNSSFSFRELIRNSDCELRSRLNAFSNKPFGSYEEFSFLNDAGNQSYDSAKDEKVFTDFDDVTDEKLHTDTREINVNKLEINQQISGTSLEDTQDGQDCISTVYYLDNSKHEVFMCHLCDFLHSDEIVFEEHKLMHLRKRVACNICGKSIRANSLNKHMSLHKNPSTDSINENNIKPNQDGTERESRYSCSKCDFKCWDYASWKKHKRTHVRNQKSVCNVCGKSILTYNFKKHMLIHEGSPVECKDCGKICKDSESLRGHAFMHKNIKLQCTTCGKIYKHRAGYNAHIKRHAVGDAKTVKCPICGKQFYEQRFIKKHIRSHTGERPYQCEYCKKGFSSSYALKTHKRQHTNEKPYACSFCPAAFPQKVSLKTHFKSKHPTENVPL